MTHNLIAREFVIPTAIATALAIMLSIGAVYLTDKHLVPASRRKLIIWPAPVELLSCQILTDGFRVFAFCYPGEPNTVPGRARA